MMRNEEDGKMRRKTERSSMHRMKSFKSVPSRFPRPCAKRNPSASRAQCPGQWWGMEVQADMARHGRGWGGVDGCGWVQRRPDRRWRLLKRAEQAETTDGGRPWAKKGRRCRVRKDGTERVHSCIMSACRWPVNGRRGGRRGEARRPTERSPVAAASTQPSALQLSLRRRA